MRCPHCQFENRVGAIANPWEFGTTCLNGTNAAELPVKRPTD